MERHEELQQWAGPGLSISPVPHPTPATHICPPPDPRYSNLDLQTQEAYEMAVKGLIRPMNKSPMLITGIRCLHFAPPEFLLGKLPQEVGAGRWDSTECPCRGRHMPAPNSAGQGSKD